MTREVEGQTVGTRIVLLLSCYSRWKGNMVCPRETTQKGIAEKLGLTRAHVAVELGRSHDRGWIEEGEAYINGAKRMAKVYFLTHLGERLAVQLKEMMRGEKDTQQEDDGGMRRLKRERTYQLPSVLGTEFLWKKKCVLSIDYGKMAGEILKPH